MNWLPRGSFLGDLNLTETLIFYDGPRVFSCRSLTDQLYLAAWALDGERSDTWLYTPISSARYAMVRSGGIELRAAFTRPEGFVYSVEIQHEEDEASAIESNAASISPINPENVPDAWLPAEDFRLDISTETLPSAVGIDEIARRARQESRTRLRIEVDLPKYSRTEAPTRKIGELLVSTQNIYDNIGLSILELDPPQRGRVPSHVMNETASEVVGLAAASFVIEIASNKLDDLFGDSTFADVTKRLLGLLKVGPEREALLEQLASLRPRGAKSFRSFIGQLSSTNGDVTIAAAGANLPAISEKLTADRLETMYSMLNIIVPDEASELRGRMRLYGADLTRRTFGLLDESTETQYEGRISDRAFAQVNHSPLNDRYDVVISEFPLFDEAIGERKPRYVLEQLTAIEDDGSEPVATYRTVADPADH